MFWADQLIVYINSVIEMASALCILHFLCGKDAAYKKYKILLFFAVELAVLISVNFCLNINSDYGVIYIIFFLYALFQYHKKIGRTIIFSITSLILPSVIEILVCAPCLLFQKYVTDSVYSLSVVILTFLIVCAATRKLSIEMIMKYRGKLESYAVILFLISGIVVLYTIVYTRGSNSLSMAEYFYSACCLLVIVLSILKLYRERVEKRLHREYSEKYEDVLEQIRGQQHKFDNQIDAIYAMHNLYSDYDELVEKQQEYAGTLKEMFLSNEVVTLSNPIVIAHVYQKMNEILEHDINLHTEFSCSLNGLEIPDIQLVNVIGTLLDNAMEALLEQKENREMYFYITESDMDEENQTESKSGACIEVGNAHDRILISQWVKFFERGYSEKGENRGLGLYELKKIVKRYHGEVVVQNREKEGKNFFSIAVVFETE